MTSSSNNTDKPTKKITPSALKNSIDLAEKPVLDALRMIINNVNGDRDKYIDEKKVVDINPKELTPCKLDNSELCFDEMKYMLLGMRVQDLEFAKQAEKDREKFGFEGGNSKPTIRVFELGETALFLQRAKEIVDTNLQISEDDKTELLAAGKNALEEMANIAKKRGWGEMDIPELKFKEPLRVVEHSNVMEVK